MGNKTQRISDDRKELIVRLYSEGLSRLKVRDQVGTSIETVNKVLAERGIEFRPHFSRKIPLSQFEVIHQRYLGGEHISVLAADYGVADAIIRKVLDRMSTKRRDDRGRKRIYTADEIETIRRMADQGASQNTIAKALGSAQTTISKLMKQERMLPAYRGAAARERHHNWTGGRTKHPTGYWQVRLETSDPMFSMTNRTSCVMEHRLVMARSIGRPLLIHETVHHINGDRMDNRLENLQLRTGQHGSGAAFRCLDCGSTNIEAVKLHETAEA